MKILILLLGIVLVPSAILFACLGSSTPTARLIAYVVFPALLLLFVLGQATLEGRRR